MSGNGNPGRTERRIPVSAAMTRSLEPIPGGMDDDEALLRSAAAGDAASVRRLYREHLDRVTRCVARILGPSDPDVEDVVQHVFLAALEGAERFDGRSKVSTWIVGIAMRRALDQARARWRRGRWTRVTEWVGLGRPAAAPDARHDALAIANAAMAKLTPDQRAVFVLHEVEGYAFQEIQEMTGVGISTLHARLKAARKRLDEAVVELEGGAS
jgi:RNA polymerase sigma-70 factor, ECF subfamily